MSLICCPECGRQISDLAELCPQCGYPIAEHREDRFALVLVRTVQESSTATALRTLYADAGIRDDLSETEARQLIWNAPFVICRDLSYGTARKLLLPLIKHCEAKLVHMEALTDESPEGLNACPAVSPFPSF